VELFLNGTSLILLCFLSLFLWARVFFSSILIGFLSYAGLGVASSRQYVRCLGT
jgi:hypothetical protein